MTILKKIRYAAYSVAILCGSAAYSKKVYDFNKINTHLVEDVYTPKTYPELAEIVKNSKGKLSIKGAAYSMGGQTVSERGVQLDLQHFNKLIKLDANEMNPTATVQGGMRWYDLQKIIDKKNLSVKVMQSYANFSVGGSLSVNVHGRYLGYGPIISTVKSIKVMLADGSIVDASREDNADLFSAVIGGYGGLGIILEATLELSQNTKLERKSFFIVEHDTKKLVKDYLWYFRSKIVNDPNAVMTNANIDPDNYSVITSTTYVNTDKELTIKDRLQSHMKPRFFNTLTQSIYQIFDFALKYRKLYHDFSTATTKQVVWRNWEASYDVKSLYSAKDSYSFFKTPFSFSKRQTLLQEYFIPVDNLPYFIDSMAKIYKENDANILNISLRHVPENNKSILSWSRSESFAVVVYYVQNYSKKDKGNEKTKKWTREVLDEVVKAGGSFYLPYQKMATKDQFNSSYPRASEYFDVKREFDPNNRFSNLLIADYGQDEESNCSLVK